ncbi:MAG TPA: NifU family protein [Blastocatellia bacterium]|nr:NifU family protein [Blastocatellia bacterium]
MEEKEFQQRIQRIDALVRKVETLADAEARATALELFQTIMDLHGAGLERMMEIVFDGTEAGGELIDKFARDDLVASLLLLYGLHPLDLEERVIEALEQVRPSLRSHGATVELLGVRDGVVRVRIEKSSNGCGSSAQGLKQAVEEAIYGKAPDIAGLEVEGGMEPTFSSGLVKLAGLSSKR